MRVMSLNYEITSHWNEKDQLYIAEVPELPGCMAHGSTSKEALKNIDDAIRFWVDTAQKYGDPVPEPKGCRLMLA